MSEPIWIEASSIREAADVVETLARHGINGSSVATDDGYFVRVPATREGTPDLLHDLALALARTRGGEEPVPLAVELRGELKRLGAHPVREIERLGREAAGGASPATPAILIAGVALSLWCVVALVIAAAFLAAHVLG